MTWLYYGPIDCVLPPGLNPAPDYMIIVHPVLSANRVQVSEAPHMWQHLPDVRDVCKLLRVGFAFQRLLGDKEEATQMAAEAARRALGWPKSLPPRAAAAV